MTYLRRYYLYVLPRFYPFELLLLPPIDLSHTFTAHTQNDRHGKRTYSQSNDRNSLRTAGGTRQRQVYGYLCASRRATTHGYPGPPCSSTIFLSPPPCPVLYRCLSCCKKGMNKCLSVSLSIPLPQSLILNTAVSFLLKSPYQYALARLRCLDGIVDEVYEGPLQVCLGPPSP